MIEKTKQFSDSSELLGNILVDLMSSSVRSLLMDINAYFWVSLSCSSVHKFDLRISFKWDNVLSSQRTNQNERQEKKNTATRPGNHYGCLTSGEDFTVVWLHVHRFTDFCHEYTEDVVIYGLAFKHLDDENLTTVLFSELDLIA